MKNALYLCAILFAMSLGVCGAQKSGDNLADRLRKSILGEPESAVAITMEEITAATPEKRKLLAVAASQIIDDAFKVSPPWSIKHSNVIVASTDVLRALADEDAIVAAFASRLDKIPPSADCETEVFFVLGRCHNPAAIEAIAKLARQRLKEITPWLPEPPPSTSEDQMKTIEAQVVSFLHAVEGLAASNSISGKNTARELRDEFFKLHKGVRNYEEIRAEFTYRIDRFLEQGVQPSSQPGGTGAAVAQPSPNQRASGTSAPMSVPERTQGAPKIGMAVAAGIGGVIVLGILIWFLRRK
ncbi:MAG: hypothetical protein WC740_06720 [Verrucomicrobiia bacterium]